MIQMMKNLLLLTVITISLAAAATAQVKLKACSANALNPALGRYKIGMTEAAVKELPSDMTLNVYAGQTSYIYLPPTKLAPGTDFRLDGNRVDVHDGKAFAITVSFYPKTKSITNQLYAESIAKYLNIPERWQPISPTKSTITCKSRRLEMNEHTFKIIDTDVEKILPKAPPKK